MTAPEGTSGIVRYQKSTLARALPGFMEYLSAVWMIFFPDPRNPPIFRLGSEAAVTTGMVSLPGLMNPIPINAPRSANHLSSRPERFSNASTSDDYDMNDAGHTDTMHDTSQHSDAGQDPWPRHQLANVSGSAMLPSSQDMANKRWSNCFLCSDVRSAPLRVEGKSTNIEKQCFFCLKWISALLRAEGKSASTGSRELRSVHTELTLEVSDTERASSHATASQEVPKVNATAGVFQDRFTRLLSLLTLLGLLSIVISMAPSSHPSEATLRVPPRWGPEMESTYSFRNYAQDTLLWCITSSLQPEQQCSAIIQRLSGAARELARQMTPAEMMYGGMIDGNPVDPVTLLFHGMQERFAPLQDETRLAALTSFMTFSRRGSERINELLTRFETVQHRAESEANFHMSHEGLAYTLLRIVGVNDQQLIQLLQPYDGNFPTTAAQYNSMLGRLR